MTDKGEGNRNKKKAFVNSKLGLIEKQIKKAI